MEILTIQKMIVFAKKAEHGLHTKITDLLLEFTALELIIGLLYQDLLETDEQDHNAHRDGREALILTFQRINGQFQKKPYYFN